MRKSIFLAMCFSILSCISFNATASPPSYQSCKISELSKDVGWPASAMISENIDVKAFVAVYNHSDVLAAPVTDVGDMLPVINEKKGRSLYVSHNRKLNRKLKQKFGINKAKHDTNKVETPERIPEPEFTATIWQWLSSNVKDQS